MYYESSDFLETADSDTLKQIARTRELTRKYYFSDYRDTEKRTSILRELLGGIGENVAIDTPFHCDYGKNIFLGNDVIIISALRYYAGKIIIHQFIGYIIVQICYQTRFIIFGDQQIVGNYSIQIGRAHV